VENLAGRINYEQEYERRRGRGRLAQTGKTRKRGTKITFKLMRKFRPVEFSFESY